MELKPGRDYDLKLYLRLQNIIAHFYFIKHPEEKEHLKQCLKNAIVGFELTGRRQPTKVE